MEKLTKDEISTLLNIMTLAMVRYKSKEIEMLDIIYEKLENMLNE